MQDKFDSKKLESMEGLILKDGIRNNNTDIYPF